MHLPSIPERVRSRLKSLLKFAGKPAFDVMLEKNLKDEEFREWWEKVGGYQTTPSEAPSS
jgi:hypothetical protein